MEDLRAKVGDNFTDKEIEDFVNMGAKIASKSVLAAMCELVKTAKNDSNGEIVDNLVSDIIKRRKYDYCGFITIEMEEIQAKLNLCLSIVEQGYKAQISIPSDRYIQDLYDKYNFLRQSAIAYWHQFMAENPAIVERIKELLPNSTIEKLQFDPDNATTLFWDKACPKWIGIFPYYTDKYGRAYYK